MSDTISTLYNNNNDIIYLKDTAGRTLALNLADTISATVYNAFYPVGSIFISASSTDPGTIMTGTTWELIQDRMLMAKGTTYTANTGGLTHITLTSSNLPSHSHSFTGTAVTSGEQSKHHTHTATTGNNTASHTHDGTTAKDSGHTHTGPSHAHEFLSCTYNADCFGAVSSSRSGTSNYKTRAAGTGASGPITASHTHTVTYGDNSKTHTHSLTTGAPSKGHNHKYTASGTITNTGNSNPIEILPPYKAVNIWKRIS